jgi:tight adherence protein C
MEALLGSDLLVSPALAAALAGLAMACIWIAFAPAPPRRDVRQRLDDYLERGDVVMDEALSEPFLRRAVWPTLRSLLHMLGRLLPSRSAESTRQQLQQAGNPGGLIVLDFYGIRVLVLILAVGLSFLLYTRSTDLTTGLLSIVLVIIAGYVLPLYWLRTRIHRRRDEILRALPDALDMLTIAVEAGLAFESAMVRVGDRWDNALTREFRRAAAEMRVGMSREEALSRMAARCNVAELTTFIAVLVQSSQLGVGIAAVLHAQAMTLRDQRRQRAEELARQAGIKMLIPLVFFILPALFVAILGPAVPGFIQLFGDIMGK